MNEVNVPSSPKLHSFKDPGKFVAAGEKWLRDLGVTTEYTHQGFQASLVAEIYWLKDFEYFLNQEELTLRVVLKFSFWGRLFANRNWHKDRAILVAKAFFPYYETTVSIEK